MSILYLLIYPFDYLDVRLRKPSVLGVTDFGFLNGRQVPIRPAPQLVFRNTNNLCDRADTESDVCLVHDNFLL